MSSDVYSMCTCTPPSIATFEDVVNPLGDKNIRIFEAVREDARAMTDEGFRSKILKFIDRLERSVIICGLGDNLPRILDDISDTEFYLEWPFRLFTVGFNISKDGMEDGWFLISEDQLGTDEHGENLSAVDYIVEFIRRYGDA